MDYRIDADRITVFDTADFDLRKITECGQLFRYDTQNNITKIFAKNCKCVLKVEKGCVIINTIDVDFFKNYFDLSTDYSKLRAALAPFEMTEALDFGKGLRILRQDPEETIFSFIVSANNNIPRIKGILERLAVTYGKPCGDFYAFPTADALAEATDAQLKSLGIGYRASYLIKTAEKLRDGFDLNLFDVETSEARRQLMQLPGVGAKVADCILLFAYGKSDVFPVDTWVKKIYCDRFCDQERNVKKMAEVLTETFKNLSGYAQQYLFYYYRNNKIPNL